MLTVPVTLSGLYTPLPAVGEPAWTASTAALAFCLQTLASSEGTSTPPATAAAA
jgi:hypothetical protein